GHVTGGSDVCSSDLDGAVFAYLALESVKSGGNAGLSPNRDGSCRWADGNDIAKGTGKNRNRYHDAPVAQTSRAVRTGQDSAIHDNLRKLDLTGRLVVRFVPRFSGDTKRRRRADAHETSESKQLEY